RISHCTRAEGSEDPVTIVENGQHNNVHIRQKGFNMSDPVYTAHARQVNIAKDYFGRLKFRVHSFQEIFHAGSNQREQYFVSSSEEFFQAIPYMFCVFYDRKLYSLHSLSLTVQSSESPALLMSHYHVIGPFRTKR